VTTWRALLDQAAEVVGSRDEARRLVEEASGLGPSELLLALDDVVPARAGAYLTAMLGRRTAGEPLQYALGRWGFRSLDLMVDRRVLIPRPETEVVAGVAVEEARRFGGPVLVADLGTGSGAIALSIAAEVPGAEVWATDVSAGAVDVASANLCGLGGFAAARVRVARGAWYDALPTELAGRVHVIVSNPPYVADGEELPPEVDEWEPRDALRAGPTGLECLAAVITGAPRWLRADGVLVLEHAPHQAADVTELALAAGFAPVDISKDLAGRDRVAVARR
jgi:release factor glutamine methyltransferase